MLIGSGLAEAVVEGPELYPGQLRPGKTFETPLSTLTVGPMSIIRKVAPQKTSATGKVTIWGLPPMVAYAIIAVTLTGAGLWTYQKLSRSSSGGGRRYATNPPRRRRKPRAKRARYKR